MRLSVQPSTSTTLPVVRAHMVHVSTSLNRSRHGSMRTLQIPHQFIGSLDWLDLARPPSPTRSANRFTKIACHSLPSSARCSSIAGTRSSLSLLCVVTLPNSIAHTQPMFCQSWKQTQKLPTLTCAFKLTNCWSSPGKPPLPREKTVV